ncbi:MAG: hypothetical protein GF364_20480 [Candidatus Lokiarchaeota archaeon]|nr:hypothetical protein [Candidatus Lokiarchaeota archaeon]
MTNIGILGAVSTDKNALLRFFEKSVKTIDKVEIVKTDFSGEAVLDPDGLYQHKERKPISPNRVCFRDVSSRQNHTIFAPRGVTNWSVVRSVRFMVFIMKLMIFYIF